MAGFPTEQVHVETRAQWRAWLVEHADRPTGVCAVTWRKASGRPVVAYAELVEEALCVGWIDSVGRAVDDDRTSLLFTPRKRGSGWSRPNKERLARLTADGLMHPRGLAVVEAAKADGSWTKLDAVEDLVEPDELRAALDATPDARREWDAFPRSAKRAILEWIGNAKRPETRERRVRETAELAARGERANQWKPKT